MEKRCCENCVYATRLSGRWLRIIMAGWSGLRICFNSGQAPGRMQEVYPTGCCRNFCPKPVEQHHVKAQDGSSSASQRKGETRLIPLTHGLHAIVDAADYEWLSQYKWFLWGGGYAARHVPGGVVLMHRQITNAPPGRDVDHTNGNRLDNRSSNLRICTRAENLRNTAKRPGCLSRYKGVSLDRRHNKWVSQICFESKTIRLGSFTDEAEAARTHDRAALALFGEYAWLNFPEEIETRRQEIATPQYRQYIAAKLKTAAKQKPAHAKPKPASRKSRAATPSRRADKQKKNRSTTKVTKPPARPSAATKPTARRDAETLRRAGRNVF
jgi:hypothetical protein